MKDGWTELEVVRLTGSAWGPVAFLSLDEKGGEEGIEGLADGGMKAMRSTYSARGMFAFLPLNEEGGNGKEVGGLTDA